MHAVHSLADVVCGCALLGGLVRPAKEGRKEGWEQRLKSEECLSAGASARLFAILVALILSSLSGCWGQHTNTHTYTR